jgi:hypothetical protein
MPDLVADNVRVGVTGGVYVAASGTSLPTNATSALAAGLQSGQFGYIDEAGVSLAIDEETTDIRAWQNGATVRTTKTGQTVSLSFTAMETNSVVLDNFFPGGFAASAAELTAEQSANKVWVVQVEDQGNDIRLVFPSAQVTSRGTVTFANGSAVTYPFTISAYPDSSGVSMYYYIASEAS